MVLVKCDETGKLSAAKCQKVKHERDKIVQLNEANILRNLKNCHLIPSFQGNATHKGCFK